MRNRRLWGILAVALVLRVALLAAGWGDVRHFMTPDSEDYCGLARTLRYEGAFQARGWFRDVPEIFRTPGYPLFLATTYGGAEVLYCLAWDVDPVCPIPADFYEYVPRQIGNRAALIVQVFLDVLLVAVTFCLARRLCGERVALWAAGFQAVTPAAVVSSVRLLSDGPFALLLTLGILLIVIHFQDRRWWAIPFAGVCIGAAALVRPIAGPYISVLTAVILIAGIRRPQWALVFAVCAGAFVAPWMARNYIVADGEYWQLSSVGDYNLWNCNAADFAKANPEIRDVRLPTVTQGKWIITDKNDPGSLKYWRETALQIIRKYPFRYAWFHFRTSLNCFLPAATDVLEVAGVTGGEKGTLAVIRNEGLAAGVRHYFGGRTWPIWLAAPMVLLLLIEYAVATVGAVRHVRPRMGPAGWLILITILFYVFVPGPVAHARFRVPICPLLSIVAAAGAVFLIDAFRRVARPRRKSGQG